MKCINCNKNEVEGNKSFCSRQCFLQSKRVELTCNYCNQTFIKLKCHDSVKFCNRKCYSKYTKGKRKEDSAIDVHCDQCGSEFSIYKSQFKEQSKHFCDRDCYLSFHRKDNNDCQICGIKTINDKFCSRDCYKQSFDSKNFGKKHKKGYYKKKDGCEVWYDSSWELRRMKELDYSDSVQSWTRCNRKIQWTDNEGKDHYYNPDFEIIYKTGKIVVEEVKGFINENSLRKAIAAEKLLFDLGITYRMINLDDFEHRIEVHLEDYQNDYGTFHRPSLYYMWMQFVFLLERRSTCLRNKVGSVIVTSDMQRALCLGYNGNYSGGENQCDSLEPGKCHCVHSEINSLVKAKEDTEGCILFVTIAPCYDCAKVLINKGISKVIYGRAYRSVQGIRILREAGVEVLKYDDIISFDP